MQPALFIPSVVLPKQHGQHVEITLRPCVQCMGVKRVPPHEGGEGKGDNLYAYHLRATVVSACRHLPGSNVQTLAMNVATNSKFHMRLWHGYINGACRFVGTGAYQPLLFPVVQNAYQLSLAPGSQSVRVDGGREAGEFHKLCQ